jgi:hypothetical protein
MKKTHKEEKTKKFPMCYLTYSPQRIILLLQILQIIKGKYI